MFARYTEAISTTLDKASETFSKQNKRFFTYLYSLQYQQNIANKQNIGIKHSLKQKDSRYKIKTKTKT